MTELKTLKDIEKHLMPFEDETTQDYNIYHRSETLKEEAIKWVKYMQSPEYYNDAHIPEMFDLNGYDPIEVVGWIKHFFNITKEDLK